MEKEKVMKEKLDKLKKDREMQMWERQGAYDPSKFKSKALADILEQEAVQQEIILRDKEIWQEK